MHPRTTAIIITTILIILALLFLLLPGTAIPPTKDHADANSAPIETTSPNNL